MFQRRVNEKQNRNNHRKPASLDMEPLEPRRCLSADLSLFTPNPLNSFPSSTQQQSSQNNHDHQDQEQCALQNNDYESQELEQTEQGTGCQCPDCLSAGSQQDSHLHQPERRSRLCHWHTLTSNSGACGEATASISRLVDCQY